MGKRGRRKTNKEYAVRLNHPELGTFYYQYSNNEYWNNNAKFYFTQNLSKVDTWKTMKYVEKQIITIKDNLDKKKAKILLYLGDQISNELKTNPRIIQSRKRYYYEITVVTSKTHLDKAKDNLERLSETLIADSKIVTKMIKKSQILEKDFMSFFTKLYSDVNLYRKEHSFLEKNKNIDTINLDIVDASYSFRLLKLKTLKTVESDEINEIDEIQS